MEMRSLEALVPSALRRMAAKDTYAPEPSALARLSYAPNVQIRPAPPPIFSSITFSDRSIAVRTTHRVSDNRLTDWTNLYIYLASRNIAASIPNLLL